MEEEVNKGLKILAKGSAIVFIGIFLAKIFSYAYRIIIARNLGPELYGLFSLALMVSGWLVILSKFGFTGGISRFIPFYRGKDQPDKAKYVYKISLLLLIISSAIVGILLFIFSEYIALNIFNSSELAFFLKIFSITIPLTIVLDVFLSTIIAFEKVGWHSFIYNIFLNFVKVFSLVSFIIIGLKAGAIVFSYLAGIAFSLVLAFFVSKNLVKSLKCKKTLSKKDKKSVFKTVFSYSWPLLFFGFTWQVFHWTDSFFIGFFRTTAEVGLYNAAIPIAMLFNLTSALFIQLFFPYVTRVYSKDKKSISTIKQLSQQVGKWIFLINIPILLLILTFPGAVINLLFGKQYLAAENALRFLAVGTLINSVFVVSDRLISMLGKTKIILADIVIVSILNIILNMIFIQKYGITGAALATMISFIVLNLLFAIQSNYYLSIVPLRRKMFTILLAGIISVLIIYNIADIIAMNFVCLGLISIMFFLIYILLVFLMGGLDRNDLMILKSIRKKLFQGDKNP